MHRYLMKPHPRLFVTTRDLQRLLDCCSRRSLNVDVVMIPPNLPSQSRVHGLIPPNIVWATPISLKNQDRNSKSPAIHDTL